MAQITDQILMIRPVAFRLNEETAVNNYFQKKNDQTEEEIIISAQREFDEFVTQLKDVGVQVMVINDKKENNTPDSIFPNNWISFHADGGIALYPMFAKNRRKERRSSIVEHIESIGFDIQKTVDYTPAEEKGQFLEGTGSLLLDRENKKAYCAISARADEQLVRQFCLDFDYTPITFVANQTVNKERKVIYHTNVMMCLAKQFAVICLDTIDDKNQKETVIQNLKKDGKEIIEITEEQVHRFAGNMLQVKGNDEQPYLVMSKSAQISLSPEQIEQIENYCPILSSDLQTIETLGGGSARCMMAEVFLPKTK